jgi:hypothetical protein
LVPIGRSDYGDPLAPQLCFSLFWQDSSLRQRRSLCIGALWDAPVDASKEAQAASLAR